MNHAPLQNHKLALRKANTPSRAHPLSSACGAVAEWSKALAWKVSIRQKRIEGSNPSRSAILLFMGVRYISKIQINCLKYNEK